MTRHIATMKERLQEIPHRPEIRVQKRKKNNTPWHMALKFFPAHPRKRVVLLSLLLRLIKLFKCSESEGRTPSAFLCWRFVFGSCFAFGSCFDFYWSCLWSLRKNLKMVPSVLAPLSSSLKELGSAAPFLALLPRAAVRSWQGRTAAVAKV